MGANEAAQQYKVGKYILETRRTVVESEWECGGGAELGDRDTLAGDFDPGDRDYDQDAAPGFPPAGHAASTTPDWGFGAETALRKDGPGAAMSSVCEEIMFDSQDEDDCEELFAGVWNPVRARRRRFRRGLGRSA